MLSAPRSVVLLLLLLGLATGCETSTHRIHAFDAAEAGITGGLTVTVNAYGTWQALPVPDSAIFVSGSPYVIEVRVRGATDVSGVTVVFSDTLGQPVARVDRWDTRAFDDSDSTIVFAHRAGVVLSPESKTVTGEIRIGTGAETVRHRFSSLLRYSYREERRNRFLDRLMSV